MLDGRERAYGRTWQVQGGACGYGVAWGWAADFFASCAVPAEEQLEKDNMWQCDRCKVKTASTKRIHLFRLPQCLIVHLKRFKYNVYD